MKGFMENKVVTIAYRAPEIMLNIRQVTLAYRVREIMLNMRQQGTHIWSAACIFAEMLKGKPHFRGTVDAYAKRDMISFYGVPAKEERPEARSALDLVFGPLRNLKNGFLLFEPQGADFLSTRDHIWSVACIFAKVVNGSTHFRATGDVMRQIISLRGIPARSGLDVCAVNMLPSASEVKQQLHGYDFKADIWSFGITALELAHGHAPFSKYPPMKVLLMTLQNAPPGLDYERDRRFSKSFKDLDAKDPKKSPSSEKLLKHPFFKHAKSADYLSRAILDGLSPLAEGFRILKRASDPLPNEAYRALGKRYLSTNRGGRGPSKQKSKKRKAQMGSFPCRICGAICHSREALIQHMKRKHPEIYNDQENFYSCLHCGNYLKRGEEVKCSFLEDCPHLLNMQKPEVRMQLMKKYEVKKKD